jgi:hypothetical protein
MNASQTGNADNAAFQIHDRGKPGVETFKNYLETQIRTVQTS